MRYIVISETPVLCVYSSKDGTFSDRRPYLYVSKCGIDLWQSYDKI